jgi:2-keto-4-pentenoate hydratase/2-oxohepta-3-ene-1,7-dioic acid hydratase in catechol pathway
MIRLPFGTGEYTLDPRKIIAVGLNYADHVVESLSYDHEKLDLPSEPVLFAKTPNVLIGPGEAIVIPAYLFDLGFDEVRVDLEAELAVIISRTCSRVSEADAMDYILGYTCFNDVSQRNIQKGDASGWFRGKSLDSFGPIGPRIVPAEEIPDPQNLDISCRVNGELRQSSNTSHMIFPVATIISYISRHIRLEAGDIIATGTPEGIAPIHGGDLVEVEISGIGVLKNPVLLEE